MRAMTRTETNAQRDEAADASATALPDALNEWLKSSQNVRDQLQTLLGATP